MAKSQIRMRKNKSKFSSQSQSGMLKKYNLIYAVAITMAVAGIPGSGSIIAQQQALKKSPPVFTYNLIDKKISEDLPAYKAGLLRFDEDLISFIVPQGTQLTSDNEKYLIMLLSQNLGSVIMMRFIPESDLKDGGLEKRHQSTYDKLIKLDPEISSTRINAMGTFVEAWEYEYQANLNAAKLKMIHAYAPFGRSGVEIILRAPDNKYNLARQDMDMFFMTTLLGDVKNPPLIPELGSNI
jgi:hypothetical protein